MGGAGFLSVIVGTSAAWKRWEPRLQGMGRRGASAVMLVGLGMGVLAVAFGWTGVAYVIGQSRETSLIAAGMGLFAAGVGVLVPVWRHIPVRVALTVGALVAGASGVLLPSRFLLSVTGALAFFVLFQAWTSAPPTVDEAPEE